MKSYTDNGRIAREDIAADISDGVMTSEDLNALIRLPEIRDAFIGTSYDKKIDKSEWSRAYLDSLTNASVAEAFNEDYLNYLMEVAVYVKNKNEKNFMCFIKKNLIWILLGVNVLGVIIYFIAQAFA